MSPEKKNSHLHADDEDHDIQGTRPGRVDQIGWERLPSVDQHGRCQLFLDAVRDRGWEDVEIWARPDGGAVGVYAPVGRKPDGHVLLQVLEGGFGRGEKLRQRMPVGDGI